MINPIINPMINLIITAKPFYFFACKTRRKCSFGIIDFSEKLIDFFDTLNLFNFNSIFAVSSIS